LETKIYSYEEETYVGWGTFSFDSINLANDESKVMNNLANFNHLDSSIFGKKYLDSTIGFEVTKIIYE